MKPYVSSHSEIDGNGQEYISIMLEEPHVNENELWQGGRYLSFEMNHKKQRSECWMGTYHNGCPAWTRGIRTWGDEILVEDECLKFAQEYVREPDKACEWK